MCNVHLKRPITNNGSSNCSLIVLYCYLFDAIHHFNLIDPCMKVWDYQFEKIKYTYSSLNEFFMC